MFLDVNWPEGTDWPVWLNGIGEAETDVMAIKARKRVDRGSISPAMSRVGRL